MSKLLGQLVESFLAGLLGSLLDYLGDLRKEAQLQKQGALEAQIAIQNDNASIMERAREIESKRSPDLRTSIDRL